MYNINRWYYFIQAIDQKTCDKIRMTGEGKWMDAETKSLQPDTRNSSVAWVKDQWLMDFVFTFMRTANECAGWKYAIEASENIQITRYQPGDYFNWHRDGRGDHPSKYKGNNSIIGGRVRKLSMTILLNDDYEGGDFQFATYAKEQCEVVTPEYNKQGTVIVFPSDMEHRDLPVTKVTRYSLVTWFLGPPFQ